MAAVLAAMPGLEAADRPAVAAMLALVVGGFYIGARLLGLGVLSTFLSRPILVGFFAGISLSILVGQLGRVTGVDIEADGLIPPLVELVRKAATDPLAVPRPRRRHVRRAGGGARHAAAGSRARRRGRARRRCSPRSSTSAATASPSSATSRRAFPRSSLPATGGAALDQLLIGAAAIFLVSFAAGIVTARSFGERGGYPVDADREMAGFGAANLAAGLFSAFPITASDSRTAINASVGGRSQLASVVAAAALLADRPLPAAGARHPADPRPRRHPDRRRAEPDRHPRAPRDLADQPHGVRLRDDRALRARSASGC